MLFQVRFFIEGDIIAERSMSFQIDYRQIEQVCYISFEEKYVWD